MKFIDKNKHFIMEMITGAATIISFPTGLGFLLQNDLVLGIIFIAFATCSGIVFYATVDDEDKQNKQATK